MIDFLQNLMWFIIVLGVLITAHEYGHFWVARKCGVHVQRFSVGFGKVLWRQYDQQGTEFVIAMIPLGGYVKMLDSRVDNVAKDNQHKAFDFKNVYQRIAIIAAGPIANFLLAIIAFYFTFLIGIQTVKPIVANVVEQSIAAKAQLPINSEIIAINKQTTQDWQAVNLALVSAIGDDELTITVKPHDSVATVSSVLSLQHWQYAPDKQTAIESLGIEPYRPKVTTEIAYIAPNSAAEKSGLQIGDKLVDIANENISDNWQRFSTIIQQHPNERITLGVLRNQQIIRLHVQPTAQNDKGKTIGVLGVRPIIKPYPQAFITERSYNIFSAFSESIDKTCRLIVLSFEMIGKLVTGDVSLKNLSGPVSIAQGAGTSASYGIVAFLGFLAFISINLGIINLIPLPVLDGGHLFYYIIEMVTGKPVPEKVQEIGFKFGAIVLLSLMVIAIFNDLSRL